jgi:hypothetical protein
MRDAYRAHDSASWKKKMRLGPRLGKHEGMSQMPDLCMDLKVLTLYGTESPSWLARQASAVVPGRDSGRMARVSWNDYITTQLEASKHVDKAMILSLRDGTLWGASENFCVSTRWSYPELLESQSYCA